MGSGRQRLPYADFHDHHTDLPNYRRHRLRPFLMRRVFKTDSVVLFGIALVAPLSNRQHALSSWVVLGVPAKLIQLSFFALLTNTKIGCVLKGQSCNLTISCNFFGYRRWRNAQMLAAEAIRLTVRAPKFAMIGTICAVNGRQQLKTGLCPAVER